MAGYKVYLGMNGNDYAKIIKQKPSIAVIEFTEFTDAQIKKLLANKIKLIAYLNVGAIEKTRPYYKTYKKYAIGKYGDWDELWMNLGAESWQKFLLSQAKAFKKRGAFGLYIDNLDVVEEYKSKKLYTPAKKILKTIRKETGLYLMVNGADYFVTKCIKDKVVHFQAIQQEEVFYNSEFLTNDVINYAKAHIDHFIKNVKIFEQQRTEDKHCYDSFDRKITTLKELFVKIIKDPGKDKLNLGIDFSKQEISEARLRNKLRLKKYEREKQEKEKKDEKEKKQENVEKENKKEKEEEEKKEEQDEDSKSNGKKIDIEENGQNIDNNINADNNEDINRQNQNGGTNYDIIEISNNIKSDIYIDVEIKPKNNKEPSKNLQRIKKIKKKK